MQDKILEQLDHISHSMDVLFEQRDFYRGRMEQLEKRVGQFRGHLKWIVDDQMYKTPEDHNWLVNRYVDRVKMALEKDDDIVLSSLKL